VDVRAAKRSSNTGYSQPRHLPVPEAAIQAFNTIVNSLLLQSALSKYVDQSLGWKLIVQWCGYMLVVLVSFLPDVRFGTVSLD